LSRSRANKTRDPAVEVAADSAAAPVRRTSKRCSHLPFWSLMPLCT
jgi:hypothetical protein